MSKTKNGKATAAKAAKNVHEAVLAVTETKVKAVEKPEAKAVAKPAKGKGRAFQGRQSYGQD